MIDTTADSDRQSRLRFARRRGSSRTRLQELLAHADITIDGKQPWDPQVRDERFFDIVFAGSLAIGEAYMDGLWECDQLDELICRFRRAGLDEHFSIGADSWRVIKARLRNMQSPSRAYQMGQRVYDGAINLFEATLDPRMVYSCAYWKHATTLAEAQEAKLDLACRKLGLQPGMRVLDVGCGWGSFVQYAAAKYSVEVVGITISHEQMEYARRRCEGLPVEIRFQDYRDLTPAAGSFDRVFSAGMFEHVGPRNHRRYFEAIDRVLVSEGLFLLHTVGGNRSLQSVDPWIDKYIFPDSVMPSASQVTRGVEGLFVVEDWHNFGPDYDKTLCAWFENFDRNYPRLRDRYDTRFYRMWKFYLLACAGTFRARINHLWHFVFSKHGLLGGHEAVR